MHRIRATISKAALFIIVSMSTGCAPIYYMDIDALTKEKLSNQSYHLRSGSSDYNEGDIEFDEYSKYVHHILKNKGLKRSKGIKDANFIVTLTYGVETVSAGTRSSSYQGLFGGTHSESYEEFENIRWVQLLGVDGKVYNSKRKVKELWKLVVVSGGESSDLRYVMPILIAAGERYLGRDLDRVIEVEISKDDPRIKKIRSVRRK